MANYKHIIPFVRKWEGGLSDSKHDTASKNPSPCTYQGRKGWHTNKGVTWQTFSGNAKKLGYNATCSNFLTMPDYIWNKIFKMSYWDKLLLDEVKSQSIADIILSFAWGSGVGSINGSRGAKPLLRRFLKQKYNITIKSTQELIDAINKLSTTKKCKGKSVSCEKKLLDELIDYRRKFFISLNQPHNLKGWLNRLDDFKEFAYKKLGKTNVKIAVYSGIALSVIGIITSVYFIIKKD